MHVPGHHPAEDMADATDARIRRIRRIPPLWVLIVATALASFALQVLVPAMPGLVHVFGVDYGTVQASLTVYLVGLTVGQLLYGPLSDRFGRRPVLLAGFGLFLLGTLACIFAWDIGALLLGRALQAFGGCAGIVLSRAIVRDIYERERAAQMIAYITAGMVIAPMAGPVVGGYLYEWYGWQAIFWFVLAFGVFVTASCALLLRMRRFRGYALQVAFTTASFYSFLGGAPFVAQEIMGRSAAGYGWWFVLISGSYMAGNFTSGRIGARVGSDRMISIGTVLSLVGGIVLLIVTLAGMLDLPSFFLISGVISVGNGFSMPNGFAGAVSVDPARAGTASGLAGALQMGIGAILMTVVGHTLSDSAMPVVVMMLVGAFFAWLSHLHGMRR
jgi:MFS transporter, DHA1 family, multidrug resistance protein